MKKYDCWLHSLTVRGQMKLFRGILMENMRKGRSQLGQTITSHNHRVKLNFDKIHH